MSTELHFSDIRKRLRAYDGPESKDVAESDHVKIEIFPFGEELPTVREEGSIYISVAEEDFLSSESRMDNSVIYFQKNGELSRVGRFDIAIIGSLYAPDEFEPEEVRKIGTQRLTVDLNTLSTHEDLDVTGTVVGLEMIKAIENRIGRSAGGLEPFVVDMLMGAALAMDENMHFDQTNIRNKVQLLCGESGNVMDIQTVPGIISTINAIPTDDHNGIFVASLPIDSGHQISLVFDNRTKELCMTNSIQTSGVSALLACLNDKSITLKSYEDVRPNERFATQAASGISCGICTYVNSLNIASSLSGSETPFRLKMNRELEIYAMLIDCIDSDDRKHIDAVGYDLINQAVKLYRNYEKSNDASERLACVESIDQVLDNLGSRIDVIKEAIEMAEVSENLFDVPEINSDNLVTDNKMYEIHAVGRDVLDAEHNEPTDEESNLTSIPFARGISGKN